MHTETRPDRLDAPTKLVGFVVAIAFLFLAALFVGDTFGPDEPATPATPHAGHEGHTGDAVGAIPAGLQSTQDGYTIRLAEPIVEPGTGVPVAFTITGSDGSTLVDYDEMHTKELHLIVVRRDLTGFQHVHPVRDSAGIWSTSLDLTQPGPQRVYADFTPSGGENITLGAELTVPGNYRPHPLAATGTEAEADGYTVRLAGVIVAGQESTLALTVERNGSEVTDLESYLGAYGHLVALRTDDLAYLHVHPEDGPAGPTIDFAVEAPTAGTYALYLDFQHEGVVHTAQFTVEVQEAQA